MKYKPLQNLSQKCLDSGVNLSTIISLLDSLEAIRVMLNDEREFYDDEDIKQYEQIESSLIQILEWIGAKFVLSDWEKVKRGEVK